MEVRLFATFRENREKIMHIGWSEGMTGLDLLRELDIPQKEVAIFLINGAHSNAEAPLASDDIIALFPPVGGG